MSDRASGRYAKFACSVCDYAGYSQQLLDAHLKLRGHGAVGGTGSRPDSNPAPLLGQRPAASGLLGAYGMTSGAGRPPTQSPMQSRAFPEPPSSTIPPLFNQHNRPALPPGGLLATPTALAPSMTLTQEVVETTLAKFNLPPNAVSWKGMTSEEFLQRLEDELLKRMNPADIIKQKIDAIVHSPPSALASGSRSSQESQQQSARTLQHSESPPPVTDTEELLAMALRHNDFKIARELTDLLEKEKELQARKVALAKLIPKSSAPGGTPLKLGEEMNMAESFKQYWATKRTAGSGETSSSLTEMVPTKRSSRWAPDDPASNLHQHQWSAPPRSPPSFPPEFSFRKIDLPPDSLLPSAFLTFMEADPSLFWIRQPDNDTTFQLINQELIRLVQSGTLRAVERPAREGMGCIATANVENLWHHRVEVAEQLNNGDVRVRLVDDGRVVVISNPDNLKYVPDADGIVARSPALGIPCSLVGFQPNEQWRTAGEKCFNLFKQTLNDAKSIKFVQKNQHGVYGVEVFSDKGQSLAVFLAQKGIGFVPPSIVHAGGFSNNGPPGPPGPHNPRLIRPPNGAGPMPGPPNPTPLASVGLGPRGPLQFSGPLLNELAPRPMMGAFVGRMDAPRPLHPGRPGPMMPNRPHFFDRR